MKVFLFSLFLFLGISQLASAQVPHFLEGLWKQEGKPVYEQWNKNLDGNLKGFSYKLQPNGQMQVTEYLDLQQEGEILVYKATVLDQNQGKTISFPGTVSGNTYTFINAQHSFPKGISYQKVSQDTLQVLVFGGEKQFTMRMVRVNPENKSNISSTGYDAKLADSLGADAYGMKSYFLVVLQTGSNKTTEKEFINAGFRGHMENMDKMVKENKLIIAGPFGKNEDQFRGIFILQNLKTLEEAQALVNTDPAVKAGLLSFKIYPWYGSAALPMYLPYSERISKERP